MKEIVTVGLENEMDLILAHKRTMKLCELTGFSLIAQTLIATAVSEVSRCAIEYGSNAILKLGIETVPGGRKFVKAMICDTRDFRNQCSEAYAYAKRLVGIVETAKKGDQIQITLKQQVAFAGTITDTKIQTFIEYFRQEPPLSAYDELRRKNSLLKELAEKLKESESSHRALTDSLPLMMFSVNTHGIITYSNKWLVDFLGTIPKELASHAWRNYIHPADFQAFAKELSVAVQKQIRLNGQYRFKEKSSGNFVWHMFSISPLKNEMNEVTRWTGFIVDINAQKQVEQALENNKELKEIQKQLYQNQDELHRKIIELNRSNYELEQFAHLASHDLQEPLRKIFFYSDALKTKYQHVIAGRDVAMLDNMVSAAARMKDLLNDLLSFSHLQQHQIRFEKVDLSIILQDILNDLQGVIAEKNAAIKIGPLPEIEANSIRIRQLFNNLIANALKYSKKNVPPVIEITSVCIDGHAKIAVKDNGIGFEEQYKDKIFGLFERLHTHSEFPGTGVGLSVCKKIAELHNGSITASSKLNEFSVFEISLPLKQHATPDKVTYG